MQYCAFILSNDTCHRILEWLLQLCQFYYDIVCDQLSPLICLLFLIHNVVNSNHLLYNLLGNFLDLLGAERHILWNHILRVNLLHI